MTAPEATPIFPETTLAAENLILRPFTPTDADDVTEACQDSATRRWLPLPRPYTRANAEWFIGTFGPGQREAGAGIGFAIESAGRLAGAVDLKGVNWAARVAELGYCVAPWARGRGVAAQACMVLFSLVPQDRKEAGPGISAPAAGLHPQDSASIAASSEPSASPGHDIALVGIGADGWSGLTMPAKARIEMASVLLGGQRQLDLLPDTIRAERVPWPSPLRPFVADLVSRYRSRGLVVLASGDPLFFGIGRALVEEVGPQSLLVLPHPSSISLACARMGWPVEDIDVVSLVGRPLASLTTSLHQGRRILVLSSDAWTPAEVAKLLTDKGFGGSTITVLEQLGGPGESRRSGVAQTWGGPLGDPLNVVAVECLLSPEGTRLGLAPGLADAAYEDDGQLTKREVRAVTISSLAPAPGELLWDIGGGAGSIAIEWMRTHRTCRAITIESDGERCARIGRNAETLGAAGLHVVNGRAPAALTDLPCPDAIFIGGGLTADGLFDAAWAALRPGGRLVANTVTLESEALLARWHALLGGELTRIAISQAKAVGGFTGWRPAMPVTQWSVTKPVS